MLVFGESGCIKCISGCIRANWLYSGKVVVFGQRGGIREKVVVFGQGGYIRAKWLYS